MEAPLNLRYAWVNTSETKYNKIAYSCPNTCLTKLVPRDNKRSKQFTGTMPNNSKNSWKINGIRSASHELQHVLNNSFQSETF